MNRPLKLISGGQTGVDRAALEWAMENRMEHSGWCPKGRKAEDGVIPLEFQLKETASSDYSVRTRRNVRDSEGTVIFSARAELTGGTLETAEFAKKSGKPLLQLVNLVGIEDAAQQLRRFIDENAIKVLNVAGPRGSEAPGLGRFVKAVLSRAL